MAVAAQSIIRRVVETLQDTTSVRWPVNELVRYLNDGQREVGVFRPDALVRTENMTLAAGTRQSLPAGSAKLIEISRNNSASSKRSVRMVDRRILDAQVPGWHSLTQAAEILHFTFDPREPTVFHVYPPATNTAVLEVTYMGTPTAIAEPPDGSLYSAVTGDIGVPDIYANALGDYILYRAYTKDADYAGNAARATAHFQAFKDALSVEASATGAAGPKG